MANRLGVIRELSHVNQWRYVKTRENPAAPASRGLGADAFTKCNWINGPQFLLVEEEQWSKSPEQLESLSHDDLQS